MRYLALLLLASSAFAQPEGNGTIGGVVVDSATGDPVRKVVVLLTWHGSPRCLATARTNSAGRFLFESLPPGNYTAVLQDNTRPVFAQSPAPMPDFILLGAGERKEDVRISRSRPGSISGTVLEPDGDPAVAVQVSLMTEASEFSERRLIMVNAAQTNERGEYRFQKVGRGRYYVVTPGGPRRGMRTYGQPVEFSIPQIYPGATDWKRANPVVLGPGQQISGIDFRITMTQGVSLQGTVTGLPAEAQTNVMPAPNQRGIVVELTPASDIGAFGGMGAAAGPDRRFEFQPAAPGRYRLTASYEFEKVLYAAAQEIDLTADRRDVVVAMAPAMEVNGQVKAEPGVALDGLRVNLTRISSPGRLAEGKVAKDGSFVVTQVSPGQYIIRVEGMPKGAYERSIRLGGKELGNFERAEIGTGDPGPLEIAIGARIPSVEGAVDDDYARRHPIVMLLVPAGERIGIGQIPRIVMTGKDGNWKAEAPPGKYKLIAFEPTNESSQLSAMDIATRLDRFSTALELPEAGGKTAVKPTLVRAAQVDEALR